MEIGSDQEKCFTGCYIELKSKKINNIYTYRGKSLSYTGMKNGKQKILEIKLDA